MKAIRIVIAAAALALAATACSRSITSPDAQPGKPNHETATGTGTFGGGIG